MQDHKEDLLPCESVKTLNGAEKILTMNDIEKFSDIVKRPLGDFRNANSPHLPYFKGKTEQGDKSTVKQDLTFFLNEAQYFH